ncbi:MAG: helix-turn-helix domain containing protein [Candidatus Thiodiazotropha sp. (ex Lucinoma kastoroae)]|nr:helix-turn-helix domain containing protein [Candidatus Thiodiazotropha sp. (ex Lucinoma kastoroae)]
MSTYRDNVADVFQRLADITGVNTDMALGEQLGVSRQSIANAKSRNTIPFKPLLSFCEKTGFSLDYILLNRGAQIAEFGKIDEQLLGHVQAVLKEIAKEEPVMENLSYSPFAVSLLYNSVIVRSPKWEKLYLNDLNKLIMDEAYKIIQARKLGQ